MAKVKFLFFILLSYFCLSSILYANYQTVPKLDYQGNTLTITNTSNKPLYLPNARLQFYYFHQVDAVRATGGLNVQPDIKVQSFRGLPNNPGDLYTVTLKNVNQTFIMPKQSIQLRLTTHSDEAPSGFKIIIAEPTPIPVNVTVGRAAIIQTISICNPNTFPIPLKNISFSFQFSGQIRYLASSPNINIKVASHSGSQYVLTGGSESAQDLPSDPGCTNPLTLQFNSNPWTQVPQGPFEFKAELSNQPPTSVGSINVVLPQSPAAGLPNPTVTVQGQSINKQQSVAWGTSWKLDNLPTGAYTVSASDVNNGQDYFFANKLNVNVTENTETLASVVYQAVTTSPVTVTLTNAPSAQSISFTGQKYNFTKTINARETVMLPADTYTVSAQLDGYTVTINPNPLVVPNNNAVTITYQKNAVASAIIGGYFQSWSSSRTTDLSNLPPYVNYVYLAFMKPDNNYRKGSLDFRSVGLEFNYSNGQALKNAVATLHQKQPNTKVLVSVGGASLTNWSRYNAQGVADFVRDFGLDGADIDYESSNPGCRKGSDGLIKCSIDSSYQNIIHSTRTALPRPFSLTVAAFSIAAYGQDKWSSAAPTGEYTGMMLPFFRSQYANDLDVVNVMSYDAGNSYKPIDALAAYSNYWKGPVVMGVEVPPEAWGGHVYKMSEVQSLTQATINTAKPRGTPPGMMIWSLQKKPAGSPSANNPSAQMMLTSICTAYGLPSCNSPIISLK